MLRGFDKTFNSSGYNPSGYCEKCGKIFAEFDVKEKYNLIGDDTDYYEESADSPYDDKIVSYDDDINEKYNTIDGYTIITNKEE